MNIFLLDEDIEKCVQYHCDKHVVKMITEYNQLLSAACHIHGLATEGMYRKTHANHPCTKWVCESKNNFIYLLNLNIALLDEYTHRYGKIHAGARLIPLFNDILDKLPNDIPMTPFVAVIKEPIGADVVTEYRHLYRTVKRHFCKWKNREIPEWFN